MFTIFAQGESFGMLLDTSDQRAPPSVLTFTRPSFDPAHRTPARTGSNDGRVNVSTDGGASFDPAHRTPARTGDSASANKVAPSNVYRLSVVTPPELCWCVVSLRVRSGLITCQLAPPSFVTCTTWLPT